MVSIVQKLATDQNNMDVLRKWYTLQVFNFYRVFLSLLLLVLYGLSDTYQRAAGMTASSYVITLAVYVLFGIVHFFSTYYRRPSFNFQAILGVLVDITLLILLMHFSKNVAYGFGILINAAIAGGSIITAGRISLLFAAFASIAVLLERAFFSGISWHVVSSYQQTGILGATFFATALSSYALSRRIIQSEALANQRGLDIAKLEKINDMIIRRMNSGVILVDHTDRICMINQAAWYLLGIPMRTGLLWMNELSPALMAQLKRWRETMPVEQKTFQVALSEQGILAQFMLLTNTQENTKGNEEAAALILLEDTARMAQQAQQMKLASLGQLTASIAHEIRNPLSAMSHSAELLAEFDELPQEGKRLIEIIRTNSSRVNEVIENILQLSRRKQAAPETFFLKPWLEEFIRQYRAQTLELLNITVNVSPPEIKLFMDTSQLQQILINLCDNGLYYSKQNTGNSQLRLEGGINEETQETFIHVIDYGVGVPLDIAKYIFEPFFTTKREGTGLGLYVAKELCEANQVKLTYGVTTAGESCFSLIFSRRGSEIEKA